MSGNALKLLMMLLMVLDHISYFIPEPLHLVFHVLTRCVAPFFAYMAVEGFVHTRSKPKYIGRLAVAAAVMYAGNALLNYVVIKDPALTIHDNIFATLAACLLCLYCFTGISKNKKPVLNVLLAIGGAVSGALGIFMLDWGYVLVPFVLISFFCRERKWLRNLLYVALSILVFAVIDFAPYPTWQETLYNLAYNSQFLFILVLPFLYLYNGERGKDVPWMKYGFYVFYPLHIWLIRIIAWLV